MRKKKRNYIEYDYENLYKKELDLENNSEILEEHIIKNSKKKKEYATKEIFAGEQLEVEVYPEFTRKEAEEVKEVKKKNSKAQNNLNDKNARKEFLRLANHNFNDGDYWITFTYDNEHYPESMEAALKNMHNFIISINRKRKRRGLNNAKYMYVTEWKEGSKGIRCHHHLLMDNGLDMNTVEGSWKKGRRNQIRKISKDEYGLAGMANYLTKNPAGKKRWCRSTNLIKPPVRKNHYKFKPNKVKRMIRDKNILKHEMEKQYPGYIFTDVKIYCNEFNSGYYIYARLRKKE